jgi:hypothetical protein
LEVLPPFFATFVRVVLLADARPLLEDAVLDAPTRLDDLEAPFERLTAVLLRPLPALRLDAFEADLSAAFDRPPVPLDAVLLFDAALVLPPEDLLAALLLPPDLEAPFLGTFSPRSLASDKPIATACLREVTFFPLRPLLSWPLFISCMASSTFLPAPFEYLAI